MADIHILSGTFSANGSGFYRVVYHVPISVPNYPADASRESEVPDIGPAELTDIYAGVLVEVGENYRVNKVIDVSVASAQIREHWHEVQSEVVARLTDEYRFYGTTLTRST